MRKYINPIPDGGAPIHNNRLLTELNIEIWDAIESVLATVTSAAIVSGCAVTGGGPYNISAGVVYINGKFLRFSAVAGVTLPYYIKADALTNITKGFADGGTKNLLTSETASGTNVDPGGNRIAVTNTTPATFRNLLHLKADIIDNLTSTGVTNQGLSANQGYILNQALINGLALKTAKTQSAFVNLTLVNGWAAGTDSPINPTPQYRIDDQGLVYLRGKVLMASATSAAFASNLPKPDYDGAQYPCVYFNGTSQVIDRISGSDSGANWQANFGSYVASAGRYIQLDGISYHARATWPQP